MLRLSTNVECGVWNVEFKRRAFVARRGKSGSEAKPRVGEDGIAVRRGDDLRSSSW